MPLCFLLITRITRVLLETMLAKTPVFTTIVGGIKDFMKDKYNCIEIPVGKPKEQAEITTIYKL